MKKSTILLIEDDEHDITSVQRALKRLEINCNLHIAHDGKEAYALLDRANNPLMPDLVLLDLNMPNMSGMEFLRMIRSEERFKNLKVFIMTISPETRERSAAEQLGISGYFIKPLSYTGNSKRTDSMEAFLQFHLRKILSN